jgi:NADH dehydrogenase
MRVVVLGAGYAGVSLARRLESSLPDHADLVVVDEDGHHLVQHELHRLVRNPHLVDDVRLPLADVLDRATVREARVESVDTDARTVSLDDGDLSYDVAAVCLGAETAFYDLPGVEEHAIPLKAVDHAERIREAALSSGSDGRFVVGGAGLSGIQLAGELAAMTDEDGAPGEVVLLEQADAVAPGFEGPFQRAIESSLSAAGIDVRTGATVERADADAVHLAEDGTVPYDAFAWTGGIRGPAAMDGDRPAVRATLEYDDGTFVLGDAARVVDGDGEPVPATAQSATKAAEVAAENVARLVDRDDDAVFEPRLERFNFESAGWAVSVGDAVVATVGGQVLTGAPARAAKAAIGARHLAGIGDVERALEVVSEELGVSK